MTKPTLTTFNDIADSITAYHANPSAYKGKSTGSPKLDEFVTLKEGNLHVITGIPSSGKALATWTDIPTPHGWTTMGEIVVGDQVIDENGKPCNVVAVTETMIDRPCYRVTFNDGTEIIADANHQWLTDDYKARCSRRNSRVKDAIRGSDPRDARCDQRNKKTYPSVKTTQEIAESVMAENGKRTNHHVKCCGAIDGDYDYRDLSVDPYTMGAWLGDGSSYYGAITSADPQIVEEIGKHYVIKKWGAKYAYGIRGLQVHLRQEGVLKNKHIPVTYLRSGYWERLALLQGLMDTDGTISKLGNCSFTSAKRGLAMDVKELINSLGIVAHMRRKNGKFNGEPYISYNVDFTTDVPVFKLKRKLDRMHGRVNKRGLYRAIVSVKKVASVPVKCIEVDSPSHLYLATDAFIPTHNSELMDEVMLNTIALHDWHWAVHSPENWPLEAHFQKMCEKWHGKPWAKQGMIDGVARSEVDEAREFLSNSIDFLDVPQGGMTVETLIEACTMSDKKHCVNALLLDPWNELEAKIPNGMSETMYINAALSRLRNYGRKNKIAIFIVAHPTKLQKKDDGNYPVPTPYDINGSAAWRNKGDVCMAVWRDYQLNDGVVEVHVQKIRNKMIGKLGMAKLHWMYTNGLFLEEKQELGRGSGFAIKRRVVK